MPAGRPSTKVLVLARRPHVARRFSLRAFEGAHEFFHRQTRPGVKINIRNRLTSSSVGIDYLCRRFPSEGPAGTKHSSSRRPPCSHWVGRRPRLSVATKPSHTPAHLST